jgi:hypothetical protein
MMSAQSYQGMSGATTSVRPMTESERKAAVDSLKPLRNNARGMAGVSILMAVMINFVSNPVAWLMPLLFGGVALGMAVQVRKGAGNVSKALANGTVTEIRTVPTRANARTGWQIGIYSAGNTRSLNGILTDGVPASFTLIPETKCLLAVNGMPLRRPLQLMSAPGAVMPYAAPPVYQQAPTVAAPMPSAMPAPMPVNQDLPPPPDGWTGQLFCPKCGLKSRADAMFCEKCGFRLKA